MVHKARLFTGARPALYGAFVAQQMLGRHCRGRLYPCPSSDFAVTAHINYPEADFRQAIEWQFYGNTDSRHYLDLSIYGYGTQEAFPEQYLQIVFFPLYPALLHILHFVTRIDAFWLGFAVQLPLFAAATASFYTVIARRWDEQTAALSLALLLASPASVFLQCP